MNEINQLIDRCETEPEARALLLALKMKLFEAAEAASEIQVAEEKTLILNN